jgi:phage portal protein BeeE
MKLFGLEIRKAKKEEKRNVDNLYPIFSEALTFGGLSGKYGNMNLSAVYRAVELISDSIAVLPIKIRETDKNHSEETTQHPLYYFFNDKTENPISKYNLMKLLV